MTVRQSLNWHENEESSPNYVAFTQIFRILLRKHLIASDNIAMGKRGLYNVEL
jgi:hypothetical protein